MRLTAVAVIGKTPRETARRTVALSGLQQSALRDNQPWVFCPPLELRFPPLDFMWPPLEVVWLGVRWGEFVPYFAALLLLLPPPLLLLFW